MVSVAASAHAYSSEFTPSSSLTCIDCHGTTAATEATGPHGGYLATTNKCVTCHSVHGAVEGSLQLLPASTIKGTCETCHDGSGGHGVYGVIYARTGTQPVSNHSIDATATVPGGDPVTPYGGKDYTFTGEGGCLTCTDCHSPHAASVVAAFVGDRGRSDDDEDPDNAVTSHRLLKQRPNSVAAIANYGSDWCGACHQGRLSGSGIGGNHPVESSADLPAEGETMFHYGLVARAGQSPVEGTLGHNNYGYVMPSSPRIAEQVGHNAICQQCHEDSRKVGDVTGQQIDASEVFTITQVDGAAAGDNPRFQTFPHESTRSYLLVEEQDDLCTNCHGNPG